MQNREYTQIYEMGLGSLIGDFFQNVKDTVTGVAKAVAPVAPYVLPFVMPGIGSAVGGKLGSFLASKLGQSVVGAGIGALAGQKPVDVAKNLALQTAISAVGGKMFPSGTGGTSAQEVIETGGGQQPGFLEKYITGEDSFLRKTFDPTQRGSQLTSSAMKFDEAMGQPGAYEQYYTAGLEAAKNESPEAVSAFLKNAPSPFEDTSFMYKYGPLLAASSVALPLFMPKEPEPDYGPGYDEQAREDFYISYVADGGEMTGGVASLGQKIEHPDGKVKEHPKRIGEIAGPGTGTSDDIPAMLSDGEFVMTAKAVRNAGGGSRKEGAKNMYKLMKNLEKGGSLSQQSIGMA